MQYIGYLFFRLMVAFLSIVPFAVLYKISDALGWMLYKVFKYRRAIVEQNLKNTFPQKSLPEFKQLVRDFYRHLADIMLESVKGLSMSKQKLLKRYKVLNPELFDKYYSKGQNLIGLGSHYANWEWGVLCFSLQFPHKTIGLYKPLNNKYVDNYMRSGRAAWGMFLEPIYDTKTIFERPQDKPTMYILVADQGPTNLQKAYWMNFLNQETGFLHGPEFYAHKYNLPLIYGDVQRVKRGFYEITIMDVMENPTQAAPGEIMRSYKNILEKIILQKPEHWLWSHKRWKRKRPADKPLMEHEAHTKNH